MSNGMSDIDIIMRSLEQVAEADVDLVPLVYEHFFAACPAAIPLFATREAQAVQGKMVNELIQTVLDRLEQKSYSPIVVQTMVSDHDNWGVKIAMYDAFLAAFIAALSTHVDAAAIAVWQHQFVLLREDIAAHLS